MAKTAVMIRLDDDVLSKLDAAAKVLDRSRANVCLLAPMTDGYATSFPIGKVPNPDDVDPDYLADVTELMRRTRRAVAPNPLAQAMYPPLRKPKRLDGDD